jgi:hypothetical protein
MITHSNRHQRTATGFGPLRPANQFKPIAAANTQIFRLYRHHGKNIRQVENPNQSSFAIRHFASGFG